LTELFPEIFPLDIDMRPGRLKAIGLTSEQWYALRVLALCQELPLPLSRGTTQWRGGEIDGRTARALGRLKPALAFVDEITKMVQLTKAGVAVVAREQKRAARRRKAHR
jgi:hypothetical protein